MKPHVVPGATPLEPVDPMPEQVVRVEVVYAPAGAPVDLTALELPADSTIAQALLASGVLVRHGLAVGVGSTAVGIWGRRMPLDTVLRPGDRVELYRPLLCDPKEARRLRQSRQGGKRPPPPGQRRRT